MLHVGELSQSVRKDYGKTLLMYLFSPSLARLCTRSRRTVLQQAVEGFYEYLCCSLLQRIRAIQLSSPRELV